MAISNLRWQAKLIAYFIYIYIYIYIKEKKIIIIKNK